MNPYHKIDSLFKRDARGTMLFGEWTRPEFDYLKDCVWDWTEKIDGTNVRVIREQGIWRFSGRSDSASLPAPLFDFLSNHFTARQECADMTLYGEGYGWKIQKVGPRYQSQPGFILFDVKVGHYWLRRETVADIGIGLGLPVVESVGQGTLQEAIDFCQKGFRSRVAEDVDLEAEGLVVRPQERLLDGGGQRIISKIKARDFK